MFFNGKKKNGHYPEKEYKKVHDALDENLAQKKATISSARKLTKQISDTIPPPTKRIRTVNDS